MVIDPLWVTLGVTGLAFVLFITEAVRPAITALLIATLLMLFGVVTPAEGLSGPGTETTITVLCMFILAAGIERTGLLNDVARQVLSLARGSMAASYLLLMVLAGLLSAVMNNTPVVALMIPLVITLANRTDTSASRFLMPIAFAALMGGTLTLIGTSTNLVGAGIARSLGYADFSMFSFIGVTGIVFLAGIAYLFLLGPRLTPGRRASGPPAERYGLASYITEVEIAEGSPLIGSTIGRSDLRYGYDIEVLRLYRHGRPVVTDPVEVELQAGDELLVNASADELVRLVEELDVHVRTEAERRHSLEEAGAQVFEVTVGQGRHVVGRTLTETRFRQRFGALVLGVKRGPETFRDRLHEVQLKAGDTLLMLGDEQVKDGLRRSREFLLNEDPGLEPYRRDKRWLAAGIFGLVLTAGIAGWTPLAVAGLAGVLAMGLTGCIRTYEIFEAVDWEVILVLVGLVPLGMAFVQSGASALLADLLAVHLSGWSPVVALGVVYAMAFAMTQMITNAAAVTIMVPVGAQVAITLGLAPVPFILAAIFAASSGFLTPIGHQVNLMVYGAGEYRFTDYTRVGLGLAVLVAVLTLTLIPLLWPLTG